jgi:hypothetical protein
LIFDSGTDGSTEQVWTAPQPGVLVERMDLLSTAVCDTRNRAAICGTGTPSANQPAA